MLMVMMQMVELKPILTKSIFFSRVDIEIRKAATGRGDDYTTGCLLHYAYFDKNFKLIAADVSK